MKKVKTPSEIAAHEAKKLQKRNYKSATTKAKRIMIVLCREKGLRTAEAQLQYAKDNKSALPASVLSPDEQIELWESGIKEYKDNLYMNT